MLKISTFHLLLLASLYMAVYVTEAQSEDDSIDMTTGIPLAMDDDGEDGFNATVNGVAESAEDPEADIDDDDVDESDEDTSITEEPSMELTEVDDDMEDDSDETEDFIVENTTTTAIPEMDIGSAEDVDNDDGVASDRRDDFGVINGESGNAASNPGTLNGVWAAIGSVIGLVAILVGCGLVYSYRRYKWDGTEAAMKKVVALQMTDELNVAETEDAEFNKEAPASTYDFAHEEDQDALISSDDGKYRGENVDFLDDTHETNAALIIID